MDHAAPRRRRVHRLAEGGDVLVACRRVGFHIRGDWLKIWIASAAALDAALDGLGRAAGGGDVGADQHAAGVHASAGSLRSVADRRAAHRRRAHGAVQLAAGPRHAGGELVLRIEDTDRERSTPENVEQILDALRWLGARLGRGPDLPDRRAPSATGEALQQLLDGGHAYRSTADRRGRQGLQGAHGADRGFRGEAEERGRGPPARARRGRDRRPRRHPRRDALRARRTWTIP